MPRPRWESGMPLEMPRGARDRYSPVRGHDEMPAGVTDPMTVAATIVGDERRGHLIRRMAPRLVKAEIITLSGAPVPEEEIRERERLFSAIRQGSKRAAEELWESRRAWIVTNVTVTLTTSEEARHGRSDEGEGVAQGLQAGQ